MRGALTKKVPTTVVLEAKFLGVALCSNDETIEVFNNTGGGGWKSETTLKEVRLYIYIYHLNGIARPTTHRINLE